MAGPFKSPPKPQASAEVYTVVQPNPLAVPIPAEPLKAWRQLWHSLGSNLPWYINHSRATRRAMRRTMSTRG
jgi:hypothetical protein